MKARWLMEGCGVGIILTLLSTWGQLSPDHIDDLYHRMLPVNSIAGGVAVDLVIVSIVATLVLWQLHRRDPGDAQLSWAILVAATLTVLVRSILTLSELNLPLPGPVWIFLGLVAFGVALQRASPKWYRRSVRTFQALWACLGVSILWMLPALLQVALHRQPTDVASWYHSVPGSVQGKGRIVWILLDELSYDQTFEHRPPGLALPNFDNLASESISLSNVQPAGYKTDEILPALFRGRVVEGIRSSLDGGLSLRETAHSSWEPFDPQTTLFADAHKAGWSTGIVGWFNPYCRLFAGLVDTCAWRNGVGEFHGHMSSEHSVLTNALAPLVSKFHAKNHAAKGESGTISDHRTDYQWLLERALWLLNKEDIRFVFIHLPVPHPPSIYDRKTRRLHGGGSYSDSLALADRTLGQLRSVINQTASADTTTLIVSSDHSWRVPMWRRGLHWTSEDERATRGHFDTRPVLMVHLPQESEAEVIPAPVRAMKVHVILEDLLLGQLKTPCDVRLALLKP